MRCVNQPLKFRALVHYPYLQATHRQHRPSRLTNVSLTNASLTNVSRTNVTPVSNATGVTDSNVSAAAIELPQRLPHLVGVCSSATVELP